MASELKVNKLTGVTTAGSISVTGEGNSTTTNLQQGLAKAWTRYTTVSSTSITDSFNISSLNDTATGRTDIVFSNNMANLGATGSGNVGDRKTNNSVFVEATNKAFNITFHTIDNGDVDRDNVSAIVHGDLA